MAAPGQLGEQAQKTGEGGDGTKRNPTAAAHQMKKLILGS